MAWTMDRLRARTVADETSECWLWQGAHTGAGESGESIRSIARSTGATRWIVSDIVHRRRRRHVTLEG